MASTRNSRAERSKGRSSTLTRVRSIGGVLLVAVGLLGLVLPIIPGVPLLMAGVAVLGQDHPLIRPALAWLRRRREAWRGARGKQAPARK
jgi:hypothetical protein